MPFLFSLTDWNRISFWDRSSSWANELCLSEISYRHENLADPLPFLPINISLYSFLKPSWNNSIPPSASFVVGKWSDSVHLIEGSNVIFSTLHWMHQIKRQTGMRLEWKSRKSFLRIEPPPQESCQIPSLWHKYVCPSLLGIITTIYVCSTLRQSHTKVYSTLIPVWQSATFGGKLASLNEEDEVWKWLHSPSFGVHYCLFTRTMARRGSPALLMQEIGWQNPGDAARARSTLSSPLPDSGLPVLRKGKKHDRHLSLTLLLSNGQRCQVSERLN